MTENTLDVRLLHAAKTLDDWNNVTTIPKLGEVCLEIQGNTPPLNYKIKIGDGSSTYAALPYFGTVVNTSGNASVVVVDTVTDGSVTKKVLKFYKFTLITSTVNGVTTITPTIGDLILTVQEGDGINFSTNTTDTLVNVELEATTADTAQTIADGGSFTTITKDSNNRATKYTTFTLPSITSKINALDVADNTVITAEWDSTNKQIKLYYVKETDGIIQKGSLAYTINATDIAPLQNITTTDTGNSGLDITTNNNVKDVHHKAVTQNIVDNSNIIGEKELDVITNVEVDSYGHITGYSKDKSTNLVAADIKASVRQSDNSMWNHRVTGGTINIGEETAKISKLRGNTLVWNQLIADSTTRPTYGSDSNITVTFPNQHTTRITVSDVISSNVNIGYQTLYYQQGHKYIVSVNTNAPLSYDGGNGCYFYYKQNGITAEKYTYVDTLTTESFGSYLHIGTTLSTGTYDFIISFFDLTKMFGAGNEPATVEEFKTMFPNSYYPYNEGELLSLNPTGVKSVGFNLWDEEWEVGTYDTSTGQKIANSNMIRSKNRIEVFPDTIYYINTNVILYFYDTNESYISYSGRDDNGNFTTPSNCRYVRFRITSDYGTTYNNDICINLSDSSRNGTYEPYKESTLDLSWIKSIKDNNDNQLFPYGLLSAGSVHDEVGDNYAIKRIGSVDLGTLNWQTRTTLQSGKMRFEVALPDVVKTGGYDVANLLCTKYNAISGADVYSNVTGISAISIGNGLSIYDENFATETKEAFKTAMQGVMLYYELAEPITVYFDKKPMTYPVDDLGTETLLPESVDSTTGVPLSAPFNGTFEYKSNFKDTVLDLIDRVNNARNPVKGVTNTNQTVDKLAIYDSIETVKSSNYSPSNATIVEGATDNDIILPSVEAIVNYVNSKLSSALTYKGVFIGLNNPNTSSTTFDGYIDDVIDNATPHILVPVTGDMYIVGTSFTVSDNAGIPYGNVQNGTYNAGDFFIWNGTSWDIVSGTTSVVNSNPTLTPNGNTYQVGTVDGIALQVTTPNLNYSSPSLPDGQSIDFIDTVSQTNGLVNTTKKAIPTARTTVNSMNYDILVPPSTSLWPSIYAPTTAGTAGQFLKSTAGTPTWATLGISDLGLYSKSLKQIFNGQDTTLGNIIRNSNEDLNLPAFYAPLDAGTSYNLLMSNGSGAPSWTSFLSTDNGYLKKTANGGWSLDPYGGGAKESVMNDGSVITASSSATAGLRKQTGTSTYEYQKISFAAITNDTATGNNAVTIILNGNFS